MNEYLAADGFKGSTTASQVKDGRFTNEEAIAPNSFGKFLKILKRYFTETKVDPEPVVALPIQSISKKQLLALPDGELHLIKLGHSSILLKVYGEFWLLDPVFSERASPFSFMGPKRFHEAPLSISELPPIDKVLISHNHYDHLDKAAIKQLSNKARQFLVPLGVEQELVNWGVEANKITSFDWWQELNNHNTLIAFTPTRHFSGRGLTDGNTTLWGSWVIKTPYESLYFSGDSGYFEGFKQIGRKYGLFDLTMIETGAYDNDWADVHMTPEQSVQAHIDLQGNVMIPIHNGTFDLAFHPWHEPLERAVAIAELRNIRLSTPLVGEIIDLRNLPPSNLWWREYM